GGRAQRGGAEEVRHRRCRGVVGRERRQAPCPLDGLEQRVVVLGDAGTVFRRHVVRAVGDDDGQHLVRPILVLVVGDEEGRLLLRERRGLQDRRHIVRQPLVTGGDGAVVRVVAEVRSNERVVRRGRRRRQVGGKSARGDDVVALGAGPDVVEIDEWIVLLG